MPLDIPVLRVVSTYAGHGRGFEGQLLLGRRGFQGYVCEQWYLGHRIPVVTWSHSLEQRPDGWLREITAEQNETYRLLIPIAVHFGKDRSVYRPLVLDGSSGSKKLLLPKKLRDVTLNDNHQALVLLRK